MAFTDPQSVTIGGTAHTLPRTSSGASSGTFSKDDGSVVEFVSHTYGKRNRRMIKLSTSKIAADPFIPSQNAKVMMEAYVVVNSPISGFTVTEQKDLVVALATYLTASTAANTLKLLGGES